MHTFAGVLLRDVRSNLYMLDASIFQPQCKLGAGKFSTFIRQKLANRICNLRSVAFLGCMATGLSFNSSNVLFQSCGYCICCFCSQHVRGNELAVSIHDHQNCTDLSVAIYAWHQQICIYKLIWLNNASVKLLLKRLLYLLCQVTRLAISFIMSG